LTPAVTVAILTMVIITESCMAGQGPLLVEVNVKLRVPRAMSAAVIAPEAFNAVLEGPKAPRPELVQMPVLLPPPTLPDNTAPETFEQSTWLGPAFTTAGILILIRTLSLTTGQGPLLVELMVKVTKPAAISAAVIL